VILTVDSYRSITGDTTTAASAVSARIEEAIELLEDYLDRPLESDERTESLRPDRHGRLWPRATPITDGGTYEVDGLALIGTLPWPRGFIDSTTAIEVTYTGGWTEATLPPSIARDLAYVAYKLEHPPALGVSDYPEGATSVRLGGASSSTVAGSTDSWWSRRTRSYRYAPIHTGPDVMA
jgi:hypothetical protein